MEIKTWVISPDHKARPKNPYAPMVATCDDDNVCDEYPNSYYTDFETFATQHIYHCSPSLVAGEYPAEMVKLQRLCMYSWNKPRYKPVSEEWYQDMKDSTENVFKTQLELLQDVKVLENDKWATIKVTQSEIEEFKEVNRWFRHLQLKQPVEDQEKPTHVSIEEYNKLKAQFDNQMRHKESLKQYWLSCSESKNKWVEAIKEYFDSEHTEAIQSFDDFKQQFDLD